MDVEGIFMPFQAMPLLEYSSSRWKALSVKMHLMFGHRTSPRKTLSVE
jgi:hypothetical protein